MKMICIRFPDAATELRALGWLIGRFSFKTWSNGDMILPDFALPHLTQEGISYLVEGPATYAQQVPMLRTPSATGDRKGRQSDNGKAKSRNRKQRAILGVVLLMFVVGMALIANKIGVFTLFDPFDKRPFNSSTWAAAEREGRAPMARDLVRNHLPAGMSADEVIVLLGQPDWIVNRGSAANSSGCARVFQYHLGGWSEYSMDSVFVEVHLDNNDRVVVAKIVGG